MTEAPTASRVEVDPKQLRKELKNIERTIKTLDARRSELHAQLMQTTDAAQALSLHNEMKAVEMELGEAEERWLELNSFD
jgi:ATP-binding cassette subfamily F protein 3